jgi:hypothetical protein
MKNPPEIPEEPRGGWVEGAGSVFDTGFGSGRVDQRVTLRMFEG